MSRTVGAWTGDGQGKVIARIHGRFVAWMNGDTLNIVRVIGCEPPPEAEKVMARIVKIVHIETFEGGVSFEQYTTEA